MNPEISRKIFVGLGIVLLAALLLAIPGVIWGQRRKLVVFRGKPDLFLSCLALPVFVISLANFSFEKWGSWPIKITGLILFLCSAWMSYRANQNVGKTIMAMATKFVLVGLIVFCALLALEGLISGIKAQNKRDYKEAAAKYITGALGAIAVYHLHKLIATFVRERLQPNNHGVQV